MIVCLCEAVSDRSIREAVRSGASTVGSVAKLTRAGTSCGSCACDLARLVKCEQGRCSGGCLGAECCSESAPTEALPLAAK